MNPIVLSCKGPCQQLQYIHYLSKVADDQTSSSFQSQIRTHRQPPTQIQYLATLVGTPPQQTPPMNAWKYGPSKLNRQNNDFNDSAAFQHQTNWLIVSMAHSEMTKGTMSKLKPIVSDFSKWLEASEDCQCQFNNDVITQFASISKQLTGFMETIGPALLAIAHNLQSHMMPQCPHFNLTHLPTRASSD